MNLFLRTSFTLAITILCLRSFAQEASIVSNATYIGTSRSYGEYNAGSIYTITDSGNVNLAKSFYTGPSRAVGNEFELGPDGLLYGITYSGGSGYSGTIISINPATDEISHLADLLASNGGYYIFGGLVKASNNEMYGIGTSVFKFDPTSHEVTRTGSSGHYAYGTPIEASNGLIYSMTRNRGTYTSGTILAYDPATELVTYVHEFNRENTDGHEPYGTLVEVDGFLYGFTRLGGVNGYGVIFKFELATSQYTKIIDLTQDLGYYPQYNGFTVTETGNLIGALPFGGGSGKAGVILGVNTSTDEVDTIRTFSSNSLVGSTPNNGLAKLPGEDIYYGITFEGGTFGDGVIYELNLSDSSTSVLHNINREIEGQFRGPVTLHDGALYAMGQYGGSFDIGTVIKFDISSSTLTKLMDFKGGEEGRAVGFDLTSADNGRFYGTTSAGGEGDRGTLFSVDETGGDFQVEAYFNDINVNSPLHRMIYANDTLYGITGSSSGNLYAYCVSTGVLVSKLSIDRNIYGGSNLGITWNEDSTAFYGRTTNNGANSKGAFYKYTIATSEITLIHTTADIDGTYGAAHLTLASDGNFYGVARSSGANNFGTIFRINTSTDEFSKLIDMESTSKYPDGGLTEGKPGHLYGVSDTGGIGYGAIFDYNFLTNEVSIVYSCQFDFRTPKVEPVLSQDSSSLLVILRNGGVEGYGAVASFSFADSTLNILYEYDVEVAGSVESSLTFVENVETIIFPDANFKAALLAHTITIDTNGDGEIQVEEAEAVEELSIASANITNLAGIEYFKNITSLDAQYNYLTEIELSENTNLTHIYLTDNALTSLDVSELMNLTYLSVRQNELTGIDLTQNLILEELYISDNSIEALELDELSNLETLQVQRNNLTSLNVSSNLKLEKLYTEGNELGSIDVSQNTMLFVLGLQSTGISNLDVSSNSQLRYLWFDNNEVTAIDLSNNTDLNQLHAVNNKLVSLDLSSLTSLNSLYLNNNELLQLNIANGNNLNMVSDNVKLTDNPNLKCVQVDDVTYANTTFTNIDDGLSFSETECGLYFPDANFEAALLEHSPLIDADENGSISKAEADAFIGTINVENQNISNLIGIEYFTALTGLDASDNAIDSINLAYNIGLSELDLSSTNLDTVSLTFNSALTVLNLTGTSIAGIDFSNNLLLEEVRMDNTSLASLDVTGLSALTMLTLSGVAVGNLDLSQNDQLDHLNVLRNGATELDLSNNPLLTYLNAGTNSLTSLDLSANTLLRTIYIGENMITDLDLSMHSDLQNLSVQDNGMQSLNLQTGNNSNMIVVKLHENPDLACVTVDDIDYSVANWTDVDEVINFSLNCSNVANDILTFSIPSQVGSSEINTTSHRVNVLMPIGTDLSSLIPTFTISDGATSSVETGVAQDFSSSLIITVTAENPSHLQNWTITVQEENVVPTDITLSGTSLDEKNELEAEVGVFASVDANTGSSFTYSLVEGEGDSGNASFSIDGNSLLASESFDYELTNSYSIRVQTNDGRGGTYEKVFTISITDINDAPEQLSALVDLNLNEYFEMQKIALVSLYSDQDDELLFSVASLDEEVVTAVFEQDSITVTEVGLGIAQIIVAVTDGEYTLNDTLEVVVNNVNDAPIVDSALESLMLSEYFVSTTIDVSEVFADVDGDELVLEVSNQFDSVFTIGLESNVVTITEVGLGMSVITISATDPDGLSVETTVSISVNNVNDAPTVVGSIDPLSFDEGFGSHELNVAGLFDDKDGDELIYSVIVDLESVVAVSVDGDNLTLSEVGVGEAVITLTASDGELSVSQEFVFSVTDVNSAPTLASQLSDISEDQGFSSVTVDLTGLFNDPDNDELSITATSSAMEVVSVDVNGLSLVITEVANGESTITVTATDPSGLSISTEFSITVNEVTTTTILGVQIVDFKIFPQPAYTDLTIELPVSPLSQASLEIYHLSGQLMKSVELEDKTSTIDISMLDAGMWLMKIHIDGETFTQKMIKRN